MTRTAARLVKKHPERVDPHDALPAFVGTLVQRPVAELPTADSGDVQQDIEPSAQSVAERMRTAARRPLRPSASSSVNSSDGAERDRADPSAERPISALAPATTTRAPSSRNRRAEARPMPLVPPTIRQVRPSSRPGRGTRGLSLGDDVRDGSSILDLKNRLDFDGDSAGQAPHADGASGADARLAEDVLHQVGVAVDDLGVLGEVGGAS